MKTSKITIKLVRSFSIGFTIFSPKLNGFCMEIHFTCITITLRNRGIDLFSIKNYWNG